MGSRSSFSGLTMVVVVMLITILFSSHSCRGSVLIKANATYDVVMTEELMIYGDINRHLMPSGSKAKTGKTHERNVVACGNGAGNTYAVCGGSISNENKCDAYKGPNAC
uniref:Uncharacterized protein n=1 Tax=Cucumis sativus TaxID=3659 RepID=A0A0A0KVT8_CUCSA